MRQYKAPGRASHIIKTFCLLLLMILDLYFSFYIFHVDATRIIEKDRQVNCQYPCKIENANQIDFSSEAAILPYVIEFNVLVYVMLMFWLFFSIWQTFTCRFKCKQFCYDFLTLFISFIVSTLLFAAELILYLTKLRIDGTLTIYTVWGNTACMIIYTLRRIGNSWYKASHGDIL